MCSALPNHQLLDRCATDETWFSIAIIHPKIILELAATIRPVNGRAVAFDAFLQDLADRFMQRLGLFQRY